MMTASYTTISQRPKSANSNDSTDNEEELLYSQAPASVRIETYIPPKKRTILFDVGVLFVVFILFCIVLGLVFNYVLIPNFYNNIAPTKDSHIEHDAKGWIRKYSQVGSESVMRLIDVNGDGAEDAVFGMVQPSDIDNFLNQPQYCAQYKHGCLGSVLAVDGRSGNPIWNISTYSEIFELNCGNIDINKDGHKDCVGAGRKGSFVAFDPLTGQRLWDPQTGSEKYIEYDWNIYNPLIIPDTNGDHVNEVVLAHGGDPEFPPENTTRHPGRLLLMNGATGHLVGNYINMPDGKETYNSPVLHEDKQGVKYILIGTGGETVQGCLYLIRVTDLVKQANHSSSLKFGKTYKELVHLKSGFYTIHKAKSKGVMVPVVLADINSDGCNDIIVTSFGGEIAAYDGDTFKQLWFFVDSKAESYTTPAAGYFNNDEYLDFMMHWNYGLWPDYNKSVVMVHSGKDGKVLWMFNTTRFSMTSDLVIRTSEPHQDIFVFRIQGRHGAPLDSGIGVVHGIDPQRNLLRNTTASGNPARVRRSDSIPCDLPDYDILASEVFAVDWETRDHPRRVFRRDADKYYYDPVAEEKLHTDEHKRSSGLDKIFHPDKAERCVIMEQSSRTTGAIGDINNDGKLDLVMTYNAQGIIKDTGGSYLRDESNLDLIAVEIEKDFGSYPALRHDKSLEKSESTASKDINWKPTSEQIWTGYMGRDGLGTYHHEI